MQLDQTSVQDMSQEKHVHRTNISTISPPHHQPAQAMTHNQFVGHAVGTCILDSTRIRPAQCLYINLQQKSIEHTKCSVTYKV